MRISVFSGLHNIYDIKHNFLLDKKLTESDIHGHVNAILGASDEIHLFLHDF